jgi:hypothetical protein
MKGVCRGENQTKRKQSLPEIQSRLFENQGTRFILHYSLFITSLPVRADTHLGI